METTDPSHPAEDTSVQSSSKVGIGDLPTEGSNLQLTVESPRSSRLTRRCIIPAVIVLIVVLMAAVIGLAVGLTRRSSSSSNINEELGGGGGATGQSPSPTPSPATLGDVTSWILLQEYSSEATLKDPNSPQSRAAQFMVEDGRSVPTGSASLESFEWMERYVMTVFYYAMNGPNWLASFNFLTKSLPTCDWYRVVPVGGVGDVAVGASCDPLIQKVNTIEFYMGNLAGTIPSELGLLEDIEVLVLQGNPDITGAIPDSLQSLSKLKVLDCTGCSLSGSLPSWIDKWNSIIVMALTQNELTGSLPASLGALSALGELSLDDNMITGDLSVAESLTALQFLYAQDNALNQTIDSTFLQSLSALRMLDISGNTFDGEVPVHLMGLPNFQVLDVHDNRLTSFPDEIPVSGGQMHLLAVHSNPLTGTFPNRTITNLGSSLFHLDLSSTEFGGTMPTQLAEMQTLQYLFMADTIFDDGPIPDEYQNLNNSLWDLSLKHSGRTGTIPTWFGNFDLLVLLDLDSNSLTGSIPTEIGDMSQLHFILFNRNDLDGEIPTQLASLTYLQFIFIDHNSLTGDISDICANGISLRGAIADCGGDSPAVTCPAGCCPECCDPAGKAGDDECNQSDGLAQYDPSWITGYNRQGLYHFQDFNITEPDTASSSSTVGQP